MCTIFQIQLRLALLIATFGLVVSCLITNCPRGGKRSEGYNKSVRDLVKPEGVNNNCIPCGPEGQGVCLRRNMCCGKKFGCLTSLRYTKVCQDFDKYKNSCSLDFTWPKCSEEGMCKAKYLCCSKDQCVLDPSCKFSTLDLEDSYEELT